MATHGNIGEFNRAREDWVSYCERMQQYFTANDIATDDKKRAILLSTCGAETYQLIRSLVAPQKPTDKSLTDIITLVKDHHTPPPSAIVQRFRFHSRTQKEGETIADFIADLRKLSEHCDFGETLDHMLRDRLVCGIRDVRIQRRLLAEPDLTFKKAYDLAQASETAEKNSKHLHQQHPSNSVHALSRPKNPTRQHSTVSCYRCGGKHATKDCQCQDVICHNCQKKGHLARVCRSKPRPRRQTRSSFAKRQNTHHVSQGDEAPPSSEEQTSSAAQEYPEYLHQVSDKRHSNRPLTVRMLLNATEVKMEVDTGASATIMSEDTYRRSWSKAKAPLLLQTHSKLHTYTGEPLKVLGEITVDVQYGKQSATLPLVVVQGSGPTLLGRDWLQKITLDWKGIHQVQSASTFMLDEVLERHSNVFKPGVGLVRDTTATIYVDPTVTPVFCRPRPVPYALRSKVEAELD